MKTLEDEARWCEEVARYCEGRAVPGSRHRRFYAEHALLYYFWAQFYRGEKGHRT